MKQKKYVFLTILFCSIFLFMTSCGLSDWSFKLPNGFEVWRVNSNYINIVYTGPKDTENSIEIPSFVKEFAYDNRYVCTRNVEDIEKNNILNEKFYILDTEEKTVYGPFNSIDELKDEVNKIGFDFPDFWYRTSPDPNSMLDRKQIND